LFSAFEKSCAGQDDHRKLFIACFSCGGVVAERYRESFDFRPTIFGVQEVPQLLINNLVLIPFAHIRLNIFIDSVLFELLNLSSALEVKQALFTQIFVVGDRPWMDQLLSLLFRHVWLVVPFDIIIEDVFFVSL
jgi:hypothetical protein